MTMNAQIDLPLSPPTKDHLGRWPTRWPGITVQIEVRVRHEVPFAGPLDVDPGPGGCAYEHRFTSGDYRHVRVLSVHAGGEVRSYELAEDGTLLLAYPCYSGLWPEMDAEVQRIIAQVS
jgi:hypothetical protein